MVAGKAHAPVDFGANGFPPLGSLHQAGVDAVRGLPQSSPRLVTKVTLQGRLRPPVAELSCNQSAELPTGVQAEFDLTPGRCMYRKR